MSFTGSSIVAAALGRANVAEGNVSSLILPLLNEVVGNYYRDLGGLDATFQPTLVAGTQEYALPTTVAEVDEIRMARWQASGSTTWVPLILQDQLETTFHASTTGKPWGFYLYNPAGVPTIGLLPSPDATAAAGTLDVLYRYQPAEMAAVTESILLPNSAKTAVICDLAAKFAQVDNRHDLAAALRQEAQMEQSNAAENMIEQTLAEIAASHCPSVFPTGGVNVKPGPGWYGGN